MDEKKDDNKDKITIDELKTKEEKPLMVIKTVFPFKIFPDYLEIYRNKLVIKRKYLPFGVNEFPVLLDDIKTVTATTSLFFGGLTIEIKGHEQNPFPITYLRSDEVLEARKLITGLNLMAKQKVATEKVSDTKLVQEAKQIG